MSLSGVILLIIVAAWAYVLVPMFLRRYDQASETAPATELQERSRVLARRCAGPRNSRRYDGSTASRCQEHPPPRRSVAGSARSPDPGASLATAVGAAGDGDLHFHRDCAGRNGDGDGQGDCGDGHTCLLYTS